MTSSFPRTLRLGMCAILLAAFAASFIPGNVSTASAASFDAEKIITDDNMRDFDSMSEKEIQAFLETQPGVLKSLETKDYAGKKRKASAIIYRACQQWKISPKVMLTMLQKEQSLLTRTTLAKNTLNRAIGAGCPDASTNKYPGFGKQMWYGAKLLDGYGEGKNGSTIPLYYSGIAKTIYKHSVYGTKLYPKTLATYKLYVYNPSVPGNTNFWTIYNRYFGSPLASARYKAVYRFKSKKTGSYYYTSSVAKKVSLTQSANKKKWTYEGIAFKQDTQVAKSDTVPVYRFKKKSTGKYYYTTSKSKYESRTSKKGRKTWTYTGVAFRVSKKKADGSLAVYRFKSKKTGGTYFTINKDTKKKLRTKKYKKKWSYLGVDYYLPRD